MQPSIAISPAFIAINCAAIPRELLELNYSAMSRSFHQRRRGQEAQSQAEGGTPFLDEIAEMVVDYDCCASCKMAYRSRRQQAGKGERPHHLLTNKDPL